jgi:hypothetical protein
MSTDDHDRRIDVDQVDDLLPHRGAGFPLEVESSRDAAASAGLVVVVGDLVRL